MIGCVFPKYKCNTPEIIKYHQTSEHAPIKYTEEVYTNFWFEQGAMEHWYRAPAYLKNWARYSCLKSSAFLKYTEEVFDYPV